MAFLFGSAGKTTRSLLLLADFLFFDVEVVVGRISDSTLSSFRGVVSLDDGTSSDSSTLTSSSSEVDLESLPSSP